MKILYNIAGTYRSGGMERVLANKANWLVNHGYEVVVATTDQGNRPAFFYMDERVKIYDLGVNYEENNGSSLLNKLIKFPIKQRLHKKSLMKLLQRERPDITVSMFCNDVNFIASLEDGSRKILEIHFAKLKRLQYGRKGLWGVVDRMLTKLDECRVEKYDRFVVLTEEDAKYWGPLPNITVIPNALTYEGLEVSSLNNHKVIAVGRLTHQKGFDRLIKAWTVIHEECPDWQLDIIGEGEDKDSLEAQIIEARLEDVVHLVQPTIDVKQIYLRSSLLVMTSRYEGFGLVLTEAHSFGIPTVAFNCKCGPSDIIQDGITGFLVEEGDVAQLAEKVIMLLKDETLRRRMGAEAYKNSERFSEERVMAQWVELFNEVCDK